MTLLARSHDTAGPATTPRLRVDLQRCRVNGTADMAPPTCLAGTREPLGRGEGIVTADRAPGEGEETPSLAEN